MNRHLIAAILAAAVLLVAVGCEKQPPKRAVAVCSGCGTEWRAMTDDPSVRVTIEPITRCPECPMSPEEFEALKARVREGAKNK